MNINHKDDYSYSSCIKLQCENCIDIFYRMVINLINFISPLFAFFLLCLIGISMRVFYTKVIQFWIDLLDGYFLVPLLIIFLYIYLNFMLIFNYILGVIIKPGYVEDIMTSKVYKTNNPYYFLDYIPAKGFLSFNNLLKENNLKSKEKAIFVENLLIKKESNISNLNVGNQSLQIFPKNPELNPTIDNYSNNIDENVLNDYLYAIEFPYCKICKRIKPLRTHHCSVCNKCVLKMDHHCPWMNNCIGLYNHKYFLLFLLYLLFYCLFYSILISPIYFSDVLLSREISFICILSLASTIIAFFFNVWNWFISFKGLTALEFWSSSLGLEKIRLSKFGFDDWRQNLFYIFGTKNLFKALFFPSLSRIPFSGLEISRKLNARFKIEEITELFEKKNNNVTGEEQNLLHSSNNLNQIV